MSQSEKEKRKLYFSSRGFKAQEIEIAPDLLEEVPSKRAPLIRDEDNSLDKNLNDLDIGTRARNRAYQERLDDVWRSCRNMEAHLKTESQEAMETILDMKEEYKRHLDAFSAALHKDVAVVFDKMDKETLPFETNRVDIIEKDLDVFIKKTVPESIERQSGEVSRNLRRAYETFDIEKIKEQKRETKIVDKASRHIKNTAQRFEDEGALMSSAFFNVEDDVVQHEVRSSRMYLLRNDAALSSVEGLNTISEHEGHTRTEEDVDVLDTVIETQQLLQKTVLMHFGTVTDKDEELPVMEKLNERMAKVNANKEGREGSADNSVNNTGRSERDD